MKQEIARFCDILLDNGFCYEIEGDRVYVCSLSAFWNDKPHRGPGGFPFVDFKRHRVHAATSDYPSLQRVEKWAREASE